MPLTKVNVQDVPNPFVPNVPERQAPEGVGNLELFGAHFRRETILGSAATNLGVRRITDVEHTSDLLSEYEAEFDPLKDLETKYRPHANRFQGIVTRHDADLLKKQLDAEIPDLELMERAGLLQNFLVGGVAQIAAPENYIPFTAYAKGANFGRKVLGGAKVGAAGSAIQEPFLYGTQELRTAKESAANIGLSTVFGAGLGVGAHAFFRGRDELGKDYPRNVKPSQAAQEINSEKSVGAAAVGDGLVIDAETGLPRAVTDDDFELKSRLGRFVEKVSLPITPNGFFRRADSNVARHVWGNLIEDQRDTELARQGGIGTAVETQVSIAVGTAQEHINSIMSRVPKDVMKDEDFGRRVLDALANPEDEANEFIRRVANDIHENVMKPIETDLKRLDLLAEDVSWKQDARYSPHNWNADLIAARQSEFDTKMAELVRGWLYEQHDISIRKYNEEIDALTAKIYSDDANLEPEKLAELQKQVADLEAKAKEEKAEFDDDLGIQAEIQSKVDDIRDKITGYENFDRGLVLNITSNKSRNLKKRGLDIPRASFSEFMHNDAPTVFTKYVQAMWSQLAVAKRFGSETMEDQKRAIKKDYQKLRSNLPDGKKKAKLLKEEARVIQEIDDALAVLGGYRTGQFTGHTNDVLRGFNNLSYSIALGGVTVSSIPDVARVAFANGAAGFLKDFYPALKKGLQKEYGRSTELTEYLQNEQFGVVIDRTTGKRLMALTDTDDPVLQRNAFFRGTEKLAHVQSVLSGMNHWNQVWKSTAANLFMARLGGMSGKSYEALSKADKSWLSIIRIDKNKWEAMRREIQQHGLEQEGIFRLNTDKWSDPELRSVARAAMKKEADSIIITPSIGDTVNRAGPFDLKHPLAKVVLQFTSFFIAAAEKLTLRLAQDPDRLSAALTMMLATVLGMAVDEIKAVGGGYRDKLPQTLGGRVASGVDRSGALSIWMELNNRAEKFGVPGVFSAVNAATGEKGVKSTRYQSRNAFGSLAGPSAGIAKDAIQTLITDPISELRGVGEGITDSTVTKGKNILPLHNTPIVREILNLWAVPELKGRVD